MTAPPIQDYAVIGDGRSAALISRAGSIDWLCWPRFDSPSLFARLLDERAGFWRIAPTSPAHVERRYVDETNVLETRFETSGGSVVLTDVMTIASEEEARELLLPEHEIIRRVECTDGDVEVECLYEPRPDFGRAGVELRNLGPLGFRVELRANLFVLRGEAPLALREGGRVGARFRLHEGERVHFVLTYAREAPAVLTPLGPVANEAIQRSATWWRRWAERARYDGRYRRDVLRSALTLKLLGYAPSGAFIAAPTTSLPERIGGALNWDYRFCWVRDAAFMVRALCGLGYDEEARAFTSWLLHTTRLTRPELRVLYDVYGRRTKHERILPFLEGYRGSRPVRLQNAAAHQLQLDTYGEVIDGVAQLSCIEEGLDRETQEMLLGLGRYVCERWRQPDDSIWEVRGELREYTHSRVLCWTALDRLLELARRGMLRGAPVELFTEHREHIRRELEARAWNPGLQSYTQVLDGDTVDASLLLMSWYGYADPAGYRMRQTYRRIRERLSAGIGLLYRYERSRALQEGAFVFCSFWEVEHLALGGGTLAEARRLFEQVLPYSNDVELFAEQVEPSTGDALGNFPQGFTHVGLISAAFSLQEREARNGLRAPEEQAPRWREERRPEASP